MTRLRTSPDQRSDRALPAVRPFLRSAGATPPPRPAADGTPAGRYPTSRVRPTSQLVARGGLLAAVAIGCLGGLVGLLRSPGGGGAEVPPPSGETDVLPGSVAGVAERAVEAWLTADPVATLRSTPCSSSRPPRWARAGTPSPSSWSRPPPSPGSGWRTATGR